MAKYRRKAFEKGSFPFSSGVVLYGIDTLDSSWPIYCDHFHLYTFYYDTVTPVSSSDDSSDLEVWGFSMSGFPNACSYSYGGTGVEILEDTETATTGD